MKLIIITAVVNNIEFIKLQVETLKKFVKGEYEFIVFNDAKDFPDKSNGGDANMKQRVIDICNELNIKCYTFDNSYQKNIPDSYTYKHIIVLKTMYKYQMENPDKYLILDGDLFLMDYLDISKYDNEGAAVVLQERFDGAVVYIWPGLVYLDMTRDKNYHLLDWDNGDGDSGRMSEKWYRNQFNSDEIIPRLWQVRINSDYKTNTKNLYFLKYYVSMTWNENDCPESLKKNKDLYEFIKNDERNVNGNFFIEIFDNCFIHYRGGGCNWMSGLSWMKQDYDYHENQVKKLLKIYL